MREIRDLMKVYRQHIISNKKDVNIARESLLDFFECGGVISYKTEELLLTAEVSINGNVVILK